MVDIRIDEAVNGYIVSLSSGLKYHKEICERRIDALQIVLNYVKKECEKEADLIQRGGQFNAI